MKGLFVALFLLLNLPAFAGEEFHGLGPIESCSLLNTSDSGYRVEIEVPTRAQKNYIAQVVSFVFGKTTHLVSEYVDAVSDSQGFGYVGASVEVHPGNGPSPIVLHLPGGKTVSGTGICHSQL